MTSLSQLKTSLQFVLEERANVLARETGCVQRKRKFSGADLVQTLVFGWVSHPDASLEQLVSTAATRQVSVSDSAIHKRFTPICATFLHAVLEEMCQQVVVAQHAVPLQIISRFEAVVLEDSSSIPLPDALAELWQGCGGRPGEGQAALKIHVRWDLKHGTLQGPGITHGRSSDLQSPLQGQRLPPGSLSIADLAYIHWHAIATRWVQGSYTLTRAPARVTYRTLEGNPLRLEEVLPTQVGESNELWVRVGRARHAMRLLLLRVPDQVARQRRMALERDARRRCQPVRRLAWDLADWTIVLTDAPATLLTLPEALALLRERWQIELLFKLWKSEGSIDDWRTNNPWRVLCELYAKLIGQLIQHWLMVLFRWQDEQRSLVKLAHVVRDGAYGLLEGLAGIRPLTSALRTIELRMGSGTQMNKRKKHPNSAQMLQHVCGTWALGP